MDFIASYRDVRGYLVDLRREACSLNIARYFFFSCAIYLLALSALILSDVYYIDDWGRSYSQIDWDEFSRYGATFMYRALNLFQRFVDISPLTQLLSIIFMSASGLIVLYVINKKLTFFGVLASLPLGLSPFFLENFSYKFDSSQMSFSVLCAVLPFIFRDNRILLFLSSLFCLSAMYSLYQASNAVYIVCAFYLFMHMFFVEKTTLKQSIIFALICAISFVIVSIVYKAFFVHAINDWHIVGDIWVPRYVGDDADYRYIPINCFLYFLEIIGSLEHMVIGFFIFVVCIAFPFAFGASSPRNKILAFIVALVFLVLGFFLSYGAYLVLKKPLYYSRALIGFGAFVSLLCIVCINIPYSFRLFSYINKIVIVLLVYSCVVFSNAYGNALKSQIDYTRFRSMLVLDDLLSVVPKDKPIGLTFVGSRYSAASLNFIKTYGAAARKLVREILPNPLFLHYKVPYDVFHSYFLCQQKFFDSSEILVDNAYHSIRSNGYCVYVHLNALNEESQHEETTQKD